MAIIRWNPFLSTNRPYWPSFIDDDDWMETQNEGLSVYETDNELVVKAHIAGIPENKADVSIEGGVITIKAEHEETDEEKSKKKVVYKEARKTQYLYTAQIPCPVEADKAEAVVENGVVTITIPKAAEAKPKKIQVKSKNN